jgi:tetratricopeptide (TPR) repeat protein
MERPAGRRNRTSPRKHLPQLTLKSQLARVYQDIGLFDQAESIQRKALVSYMDGPYSDNLYRTTAQVILAQILTKKGEFQEAVDLSKDAEERSLRALGPEHPTHADAIRALADAYDGIGDLENAIGKSRLAVALSELYLPKDHPILIEDLAALGIRQYRNQNLESSRECYKAIQEAIQRKATNAIPAVIIATRYAIALSNSNCVKEAIEVLEALLPEAKRVLGPNNKHVARVMQALGIMYHERSEYIEAETLLRQSLEADPILPGGVAQGYTLCSHNSRPVHRIPKPVD